MQNTLKWMKWIGAGAIVISSMAGCGGGDKAESGSNDGVSPAIESPVMDKEDDKAVAGGDGAAGTSASGGSAGGANSSAGGGTGSGAGANGKMGGVPVPKPVTGSAPASKNP